jgi:hypothetical protein
MNSPRAFQKSIAIQERIAMRGDLTIVVRDGKTKASLQRIEIRNKITFLAAGVVVDLLAQRASDAAPGANQIYSMRMGTSNTAASRSDTNLGAMVVGKAFSDANKVSGALGELNFVATLETTDGNGVTLREAGLFTKGSATSPTETDPPGEDPTGPRMFARQTHPDIPKTSAISLEYNWRIAFTA